MIRIGMIGYTYTCQAKRDHMQGRQEQNTLAAQKAESHPSRDSGVFRQVLREQTDG